MASTLLLYVYCQYSISTAPTVARLKIRNMPEIAMNQLFLIMIFSKVRMNLSVRNPQPIEVSATARKNVNVYNNI
jgi:hypothetical protein